MMYCHQVLLLLGRDELLLLLQLGLQVGQGCRAAILIATQVNNLPLKLPAL